MKRIKPEVFIERKFESTLLAWKANPHWCAFFLRRLAKDGAGMAAHD